VEVYRRAQWLGENHICRAEQLLLERRGPDALASLSLARKMLDKGHALLKRPCIISCVRVRALAALKLWRWCGCHSSPLRYATKQRRLSQRYHCQAETAAASLTSRVTEEEARRGAHELAEKDRRVARAMTWTQRLVAGASDGGASGGTNMYI